MVVLACDDEFLSWEWHAGLASGGTVKKTGENGEKGEERKQEEKEREL